MDDATVARLADLLRGQAAVCAATGSPLSSVLLAAAADDLVAGGPTAAVLAPHAADPPASALPLRFLAALHRQVLLRQAPVLALHYPSVGGTAGPGGAWEAARAVLVDRTDEVAADTGRPCQTNEPGRAVALLAGLLHLAAAHPGLPVRLFEIGASAGLNLQVDRYRIGDLGPAGPPLVADPWAGRAPDPVPYALVERAGCDPSPIDPAGADGRLGLTSSVWADQTERFERLRVALATAAAHPVRVERAFASGWLGERLAAPVDGTLTVVWHSVVWPYLPEPEAAATLAALASAGDRATAGAPLAHLSYEAEATAFALRATTWPGGDRAHLGDGGPHGPPVRLLP